MKLKPSIHNKLLLAFISTTSIVVIVMAVAINLAFQTGFVEYLRQVELEKLDHLVHALAKKYQDHDNWDFLRHNKQAWRQILDQAFGSNVHELRPRRPPHPHLPPHAKQPLGSPLLFCPPPPERRHLPPPPPPQRGLLMMGPRLRLMDADGHLVFGPPEPQESETKRFIMQQNKVIGMLALSANKIFDDRLAMNFQTVQRRTYIGIAVLALLLSILVSLLVARRLVQPIQQIAAGARLLSAGCYDTKIKVQTKDELGQLASDFNHLAAALEQTEQTRRQWIADISHELRTPLAILRGEIEALQDGLRLPTMERLRSLHTEILGLGKLVDDLYELTLSDLGALSYRRVPIDLTQIITDTINSFQTKFAQQRLTIMNFMHEQALFVGDPLRLQQLFANMLENSRRYTDPGGRIEVLLHKNNMFYEVVFQDSAPGVIEQDLQLIFERLYRVDKSRSRALGGAGLGLSICKNIVSAHAGTIKASHSPLGGLAIHIQLPLAV